MTNNVQQNFQLATILHSITSDKYTHEVKEHFIIEEKETLLKVKIRKDSMLELANMDEKEEEFSLLLNNGYQASGNMKAGAGRAIKVKKNAEFYECIFYEGEKGKDFDAKSIEHKYHVKLEKKHLSAIFTFLRCNEKVEVAKAEEKRVERTSLELN